ncbi:hypothetical protein [Halorubellus sp. PRR65]|uniref:hypothetical protein n=1 Tax=Halorubellus sp. PRR65 TaxID=3098148 RepID=UPI002B2569B6|nr:hypothetical protein [Halorubellus sp. PRR65]
MVSRENKIIGVFVTLALALHAATFYLTELPDEVRMALIMFVGIISPMMINNYLDNQAGD